MKSIVQFAKRRIGYLDLELNGKLNIDPNQYDRAQVPKLFTELNPSTKLFDDTGQAIDPLERQIDELYDALIGERPKSKQIKPMRQAEGCFKLDREIYKAILQ